MTFSPDDADIRALVAAAFQGNLDDLPALCDSLLDRALIEAAWGTETGRPATDPPSGGPA